MSNKKWIVAGVGLAAVATAGYVIYKHWHKGHDGGKKPVSRTPSAGQVKNKRKRRLPESSKSSQDHPASLVSSAEDELASPTVQVPQPSKQQPQSDKTAKTENKKQAKKVDCDSPLEDIIKEDPQTKQRLFMDMMMRGEFFIQQGQLDKAIDYIVKGLTMVPNPGEVLLAFEQTLPEPIFKALLDRLSMEGRKRVRSYFDSIESEHQGIGFATREMKNEVTGQSAERWFMKAMKAYQSGDLIIEEAADIVIKTMWSSNEYLNDFQKYFDEELLAGNPFVEDLRNDPNSMDSLRELFEMCRESGTTAALLLFKYISLLLNAELNQSISQSGTTGPFAHYDHLRPAFRQPSEVDLKEAALLRKIFTQANPNMQDFLTDDIYAAMKYTLLFNCYGFSLEDPSTSASASDEKQSKEFIRNVVKISDAKVIGLFHIASHIEHSSNPNCSVAYNDGSIKIYAQREIQESDSITVSYIPNIHTLEKDVCQVKLLAQFGIIEDQ